MTEDINRRSLGKGILATGLAAPTLVTAPIGHASEGEDFFDALAGVIIVRQVIALTLLLAFLPQVSNHTTTKAVGVRLGRGMPQNLIDRAGGLGRAPIRRRFRDATAVASLHIVGSTTLIAAPQRPQDTMGIEDVTLAHNQFEIRPKGSVRTFDLQSAITLDQVLGSPRAGTLYRTGDAVLAAIPPHDDLGFV